MVTDAPETPAPGAIDTLGGLGDADILIVTSIDAATARFGAEANTIGRVMPTVKGSPHIVFPRRDRILTPVQFTLASVKMADAELAGTQYGANDKVTIQREAIKAERDLNDNVSVSVQRVESVEATQNEVTAAQVRADLVTRVLNLGLVPALLTEKLHAEDLVDAFLAGAGVTPDSHADWTTQRAGRAEHALAALVKAAFARNERQPSYVWNPITLLQPRPLPGIINNWFDPFDVHEWYGGWKHSAEHAAAFDSNTGEFALATLIDQSEGIA